MPTRAMNSSFRNSSEYIHAEKKARQNAIAAGKQYPRKRVQYTHVSFNQDLDPIREIFTQKINVNPKKTLETLDWLRNLGQETNSNRCTKLIKSLVNLFRRKV